ncbi:MAG: hypothetical protein UZ16_OP3001003043 [Candidatus Hinthialibacteria bacterium OLB16]|nr:MAG: hypothetical protein UZ16_OP3001003043 [Candidatus Hinthialibacteria bacterium OLB16]
MGIREEKDDPESDHCPSGRCRGFPSSGSCSDSAAPGVSRFTDRPGRISRAAGSTASGKPGRCPDPSGSLAESPGGPAGSRHIGRKLLPLLLRTPPDRFILSPETSMAGGHSFRGVVPSSSDPPRGWQFNPCGGAPGSLPGAFPAHSMHFTSRKPPPIR